MDFLLTNTDAGHVKTLAVKAADFAMKLSTADWQMSSSHVASCSAEGTCDQLSPTTCDEHADACWLDTDPGPEGTSPPTCRKNGVSQYSLECDVTEHIEQLGMTLNGCGGCGYGGGGILPCCTVVFCLHRDSPYKRKWGQEK
jgi:hypothetical protein